MVREIQEIEETIKTLQESIDDLNGKALRMDLKINQTISERQRLEQEYTKYRKLGK